MSLNYPNKIDALQFFEVGKRQDREHLYNDLSDILNHYTNLSLRDKIFTVSMLRHKLLSDSFK